MKLKSISTFIFLCGISFTQAQKVIVKDRKIDNLADKKLKVTLSQKFDFAEATKMLKPGYIKTKWIPYNVSDRTMKISEREIGKNSINEGEVVCNTVSKKIDVNSGSFMNSSSDLLISKIYAGAIYPADDFMKGNYNREVKKNRLPIQLKSSDMNIGRSRIVNNPNETTIDDTRKEMVREAKNIPSSKTSNLETRYRMFYSSNEEMTGFALSGGGAGYGVKIKTAISTQNASSKVTLTIDAYKSVYAMDATSTGDNEFYTELPAGIKANNLVMVNSVTYGSRILANLTIECKSSEDAFNLASSYSGFGFKANLDVNYLKKVTNKEISVNFKQVGGGNEQGIITSNVDDLQRKINNILSNTNYINAAPISYNVRDLVGNNMGIQSTVDKYDETVCYRNLPLDKIFVRIASGKDGKNDDNYLHLQLFDSNNNLIAKYDQPRKIEFKKSSWNTEPIILNIVDQNATSANFKKGGRLHFYADHKGGKDDWYIDDVMLYIHLSDNTVLKPNDNTKEAIQWNHDPNKSLRHNTKDNPRTDFYFDGNLNGIK